MQSSDLTLEVLDAGQDECFKEMARLKELLRKLYDASYAQLVFAVYPEKYQAWFTCMLNQFEKVHDLRIEIGKVLILAKGPELVSQALLGKGIERNMQCYADALNVKVKVAPWFERMRANDI